MEVKVEVKDIMQVLNNLKNNCAKYERCTGCPFFLIPDKGCQLFRLFSELGTTPCSWDLERIEWLMKQ